MMRAALVAVVAAALLTAPPAAASGDLPGVVARYDFEHPTPGDPATEADQGVSGTPLRLVNGGADMRAPGGAHPRSDHYLRTRQVNPATPGNDDWKAGVYAPASLPQLNAAKAISVLGWFRLGADNPALNSGTAAPDDRYNAVGLAGVLSGTSDGHAVRALLELIHVDGELKVVALGRRLDNGASQTFAANAHWRDILPVGEWVHLAATFDFGTGRMALYRNGRPLPGRYVTPGDPWQIGDGGPFTTSPTDPRGLKIGGSFPQNTREANACDCGFDDLTFLGRVVGRGEVAVQYHRAVRG